MWKQPVINPFKIVIATKFLSAENFLSHQSRNTFILKRRWPPSLAKQNAPFKKLRSRNFVYDFVEDTNIKKQPNLEVILTTYVEGVGAKGDKISLKPNTAYNKLLLPKLAVYASPENIEKYTNKDTAYVEDAKEEHSSPFVPRTVSCLSRMTLAVVMNKDVPWVLEKWHVKASLRKAGYICAEEAITLPEREIKGPNIDLENKEFFIIITINKMETVQLKCRIHHWSTQPSERLPYVFEHWKLPADTMFVEDVKNDPNTL